LRFYCRYNFLIAVSLLKNKNIYYEMSKSKSAIKLSLWNTETLTFTLLNCLIIWYFIPSWQIFTDEYTHVWNNTQLVKCLGIWVTDIIFIPTYFSIIMLIFILITRKMFNFYYRYTYLIIVFSLVCVLK